MAETSTVVETKTEVNATTVKEEKVINSILFIMFAEFLGYESPLVTWAEELCKGKDLPTFKKQILRLDGQAIYKKMLEKHTNEEIREWWDSFYPLFLEEYEETLNKHKDDLPF